MIIALKVIILGIIRVIEGFLHTPVTRWITKTLISDKEIHMRQWFNIEFLRGLGFRGLAGLGIIASFTLFTFPLGTWIASFNSAIYYPLTNLVGTAAGMILVPLSIYTFNKTVQEFTINVGVLKGIIVVELASLIAIYGWYIIYTNAGASGI